MRNFEIREIVRPELVSGMLTDLLKGFPSGIYRTVQSQLHVHAQQRSLRYRTGCKAIVTMSAEPALGSLVVNVCIDPERNEQIAIEQPRHRPPLDARSSSAASIRSTSCDVINRFPGEVGNPESALFRAPRGFDGRVCTPRRTKRLIASAIEIRSLRAKARAIV